MREAGLRCPKDLAVISADAGPLGDVCHPALTSIEFDPEAIAAAAASAILTHLGVSVTLLPHLPAFMQLLVRQST